MKLQLSLGLIIVCYYLIINIITFCVFAVDKAKARRNKWRVPEATLFLLSLIGGALGGLLAMRVAHHKTQKMVFKIGIPTILILHIVIIIFLHYQFWI